MPQNGSRWPFGMTENRFRSHFSPFQIITQLLIFCLNSQNGCRRTFWMTENHFRMHFSPFQINTQLFFKMATGGHFETSIWAILDDRKSLSIPFLAISDQYTTFFFKMATRSHFGSPICGSSTMCYQWLCQI